MIRVLWQLCTITQNNNNNNKNAANLLQRPFIHVIAESQRRFRLTALPALFFFSVIEGRLITGPNYDIIGFK